MLHIYFCWLVDWMVVVAVRIDITTQRMLMVFCFIFIHEHIIFVFMKIMLSTTWCLDFTVYRYVINSVLSTTINKVMKMFLWSCFFTLLFRTITTAELNLNISNCKYEETTDPIYKRKMGTAYESSNPNDYFNTLICVVKKKIN